PERQARYTFEVKCDVVRAISFIDRRPPPMNYPLSLHDALPISLTGPPWVMSATGSNTWTELMMAITAENSSVLPNRGTVIDQKRDRKSTRLNSSHVEISYAVFCLKKKAAVDEVVVRGGVRTGRG